LQEGERAREMGESERARSSRRGWSVREKAKERERQGAGEE